MGKSKAQNGGFDMNNTCLIGRRWFAEYWISAAAIGVFPFLVLDGHVFFWVYCVTLLTMFYIQLAIAKKFILKWPMLLVTFSLAVAALLCYLLQLGP